MQLFFYYDIYHVNISCVNINISIYYVNILCKYIMQRENLGVIFNKLIAA